MITLSHDLRIWLCAGHSDTRKGFDGLSALVQHMLNKNPFAGQVFVFRGRRGDKIKLLWWDGQGLCMYYKRLEQD
ncbi:IS66 family insertion sequence element accessory protein TnpB [Alteromonas pelagimontana]|uniref:IS66 family insertion sequence element accessory protein TnpB n=1 Tax=Alteromonas pelagimontana TaxID=1858656 RepID=UPI000AD6B76D